MTSPATEQRQRALAIAIRQQLLVLSVRPLVRLVNNNAHAREDLDVVRVPAELLLRRRPQRVDRRFHELGQLRPHEHRLGVLGAELRPGLRCPRLEQERRPLRRGLADVRARDLEVLPLVVDRAHAPGNGELSAREVAGCGVVAPAALPELCNCYCTHVNFNFPFFFFLGALFHHLRKRILPEIIPRGKVN